jgi:hypothetical protein
MDDLPVPDVDAVVRGEPSRRHQVITDAQPRRWAVHGWSSGNDRPSTRGRSTGAS